MVRYNASWVTASWRATTLRLAGQGITACAFGFDQMDQAVLHLGQAQPFVSQAQTSHFSAEHLNPPTGECCICLQKLSQRAYGYLEKLRIQCHTTIAVVSAGCETGFSHKTAMAALQAGDLAVLTVPFQNDFSAMHEKHPPWALSGQEQVGACRSAFQHTLGMQRLGQKLGQKFRHRHGVDFYRMIMII